MGFFRRLVEGQPGTPGPAAAGPLVDPSLPDAQWFGQSEAAYKSTIEPYYGSPETMARGGDERAAQGDDGVALFFYRKSIDMLHTAYGFNQMQARQPSPQDAAILSGFCHSLEKTISDHPGASVNESIREVTHRLRSITTESERRGIDAALYRSTLDRIAGIAPAVSVDDILWT
jgi:hypothetical protein